MSRLAGVPALLLAAALALSVLGATGCGDDNDDVTLPTISVEEETATTVPERTTTETTTTETTETEPETGGTGTGGSGSFDPGKEDSATNDKPAEPGTPEAAFEEACKVNPAACG